MSLASEIRKEVNAIKRRKRAKKQVELLYKSLVRQRAKAGKRGDLEMAGYYDNTINLLDECLDRMEGKVKAYIDEPDPDIDPETIDITQAV